MAPLCTDGTNWSRLRNKCTNIFPRTERYVASRIGCSDFPRTSETQVDKRPFVKFSLFCKVAKDKVRRSIVAVGGEAGKLARKRRVAGRQESLSSRVEATWRASDCAILSRGFTIECSHFFPIKIVLSLLSSPVSSLSSTLVLVFALFPPPFLAERHQSFSPRISFVSREKEGGLKERIDVLARVCVCA